MTESNTSGEKKDIFSPNLYCTYLGGGGGIILLCGKYRPLEKYFEINLGVKMARIGVNRSNKK